MEATSRWTVISVGLAIFSMFFGAGNLMYPIVVGINSGDKTMIGMAGFLITSVLLPILGLVAMIFFDGDYKAFFYRLGRIPGGFLIFASMVIIGPLIAIPRIVTLSHIMMAPFLPAMSPLVFALLFLGITFLCTFRENKIVALLGNVISPLLLISLIVIIVKAFTTPGEIIATTESSLALFLTSLREGYKTMDLLGAIFFSSIVVVLLKKTLGEPKTQKEVHKLAVVGLKAGLIGTSLLGLVYIGLSFLGKYHGFGLMMLNEGERFREVSLRVLGSYGALVIATAVLMACLSTAIALSAVVAEYLQEEIFRRKISFVPSLIVLLALCLPLSIAGLDEVGRLVGGPILYIGYPILVALTFLNIAYKLVDFKPVKIPVLATTVLFTVLYFWM